MSRRKDPAALVIEFFENASPDAAAAILGVCKAIVAKRSGKPAKPTKKPAPPATASDTPKP